MLPSQKFPTPIGFMSLSQNFTIHVGFMNLSHDFSTPSSFMHPHDYYAIMGDQFMMSPPSAESRKLSIGGSTFDK